MHRRHLLAMLLASLGLVLAGAVPAQELPSGPVRFVVGFAAGGSTDAMARIIADKLADRIGRQIVIENNAGASGRLAAEQVRKAPPNGSTVLVGNIGMVVLAPVTFKDLPYDPLRDFAPVVRAADFQLVVTAAAETGARDLKSFVAWLRDNRDKANLGVPLQASLSHLTALRFGDAVEAPATMVVYRGSAIMMQDLLGGRLAGGVAAAGDFAEQHRAGTMRILAASGLRRPPSLDDVPTFSELGINGLDANGWNGFLLPAGTPKALVERYNREIQAVLASPDVAARLEALGFVVPPANTPEAFAEDIRRGMESWRPLVQAAGLQQ
jgi:tripartite-type tricarboxylate transporter receptor subunit TctC